MSPRQQLMRMLRRTPRAVGIADTVPAALLAQVLAQQLAGARIEQPNVHRVPLHMDLTPDPAVGQGNAHPIPMASRRFIAPFG